MLRILKRSSKFILFSILICFSLNLYANNATDRYVRFDDPWERFNRKIFNFNETLDAYILRPVSSSYLEYTPSNLRGLISNFFNHISDIRNFINLSLQFKFKQAGATFLRLVINTTAGQLGLVDVATSLGIHAHDQDFGLTLASWNVGSGPYLVLPFFGSSTVRSAIGRLPDSYLYAPYYANDLATKLSLIGADTVQKRSKLLSKEDLISGDKYIFIRDAYLQTRYFLITGESRYNQF